MKHSDKLPLAIARLNAILWRELYAAVEAHRGEVLFTDRTCIISLETFTSYRVERVYIQNQHTKIILVTLIDGFGIKNTVNVMTLGARAMSSLIRSIPATDTVTDVSIPEGNELNTVIADWMEKYGYYS